ncbi:HAD-IIB family hydrolase [Pseudoruegeria sp. SHC-113]|uniref:HAD-IIB family hydrolase n=1 Tax=Pseudoruegeria sp. SHC-113 TaxID=2855439 RepID=UPI0021BA8418|nr:HAD-IIB family hydrolase [Pseudoruegeria sp. SHC-113]MCT8161814.1 HAD-IIB family hydrolase [Pseudoruegeria sp. SHC-113]
MPPPPPFLVFTDLDGTLLDHETYDASPAAPALARLAALGVPVVMASSKTAAEIAPLRTSLGLKACPAIVENGAGLLAPGAKATSSGDVYAKLRADLETLPSALRACFTGFGDLTSEGISALTGLPLANAALAARRQFSEPGLWTGSDEARATFLSHLQTLGIHAREGGRFLTLSYGATKADRMAEIRAGYGSPRVIALGDAPNDREMLEAADVAAIIANPARAPLPPLKTEAQGKVLRPTAPGPEGWNAAIHQILDQTGLEPKGAIDG